jgi:hypothetical protein
MVQIYINQDGLAKKLYACGLIKSGLEFGDFVRSFTINQPLFCIADVGAGKERADYKLRGMYGSISPLRKLEISYISQRCSA